MLKLCRHMGWSLDDWHSLSEYAKDMHLAYEVRRTKQLAKWRENLAGRKLLDAAAATTLYVALS